MNVCNHWLVFVGLRRHVGNLYGCSSYKFSVCDLPESDWTSVSSFLDHGVMVYPLPAKGQSWIGFFNLWGILAMMLHLPFHRFLGWFGLVTVFGMLPDLVICWIYRTSKTCQMSDGLWSCWNLTRSPGANGHIVWGSNNQNSCVRGIFLWVFFWSSSFDIPELTAVSDPLTVDCSMPKMEFTMQIRHQWEEL